MESQARMKIMKKRVVENSDKFGLTM